MDISKRNFNFGGRDFGILTFDSKEEKGEENKLPFLRGSKEREICGDGGIGIEF